MFSKKDKKSFILQGSLPDLQNLTRHHTQDLDIDPIELIETDPTARAAEPDEQLLNHFAGVLLRTVEHDAVARDHFRQVFAGLRFPSACRTGRVGTQFRLKRRCYSQPTTLS
jgi:hypothetical protein